MNDKYFLKSQQGIDDCTSPRSLSIKGSTTVTQGNRRVEASWVKKKELGKREKGFMDIWKF